MNMKQKRTPLKVEFKQFQRLPEWPIAERSTNTNVYLEGGEVAKIQMAALMIHDNRFGVRSLAE